MPFRLLTLVMLALSWSAVPSVGWAEEVPASPPPKVRRAYSGRTTLVDRKAEPAQPSSSPSVRIPMTPVPGNSSVDALLRDGGPASMPVPTPATLPAPNRPPTVREEDRRTKTWTTPDNPKETKPSGWGWLADDLMRNRQVDDQTPDLGDEPWDPLSRNVPRERMPRPGEREDVHSPAEVRPVDGQSSAMTEEELVRAGLNEVSSSTAPQRWRPIGSIANDRGWSPAIGATGDRDRATAEESGPNRSAFDTPALDDPTRRWSVPGDDLFRVEETPDERLESHDRALFKNPDDRDSSGAFDRSGERGAGLFDPAKSSPGGGTSGLGFSSPAPVFGGMNAVDIPPSLSGGSSLDPTLSMPSASTPSLGGMDSEMESRPKTLPW